MALLVAFASAAPLSTPVARADAATVDQVAPDHWMTDMQQKLGYYPIGHVIIPASHDSATSELALHSTSAASYYAIIQDIGVTAQLQDGIRELDVRATYHDWGNGSVDYFISHSDNYISELGLETVLDQVGTWAADPGHAKEIVILRVTAGRPYDPTLSAQSLQFGAICGRFRTSFGARLITPNTAPGDIAAYDMNQLWALRGQPNIIIDWPDCIGSSWPKGTWNNYWANQCYANDYTALATSLNPLLLTVDPLMLARPGIINAVQFALDGRLAKSDDNGQFGGRGAIPTQPTVKTTNPRYEGYTGFYSLGVHGTITTECALPTDWFLPQQALALDALKGWFDQDQYHARNRVNVIAADFIEKSRLVEYAIAMNWEMD